MDEFLILTTEINVRTGPTIVGNKKTSGELMEKLGASLKQSNSALGNTFWECAQDISQVMQSAKRLGYTMVSSTGLGQTFIVVMELQTK